jgi:peptidoglycan hydrolase-like protein with peptidoglycan-binding domain
MSQVNGISEAEIAAGFLSFRKQLAAVMAAAMSVGLVMPGAASARPGAPLIFPGDGCPAPSASPGIRCVQSVLNDFTGHPLAVDGCYGPASQRAVYDLQRFFGLNPDSVVGPLTGDVIDTILRLRAPEEIPGWEMVCWYLVPTLD